MVVLSCEDQCVLWYAVAGGWGPGGSTALTPDPPFGFSRWTGAEVGASVTV